MAKSQKDTCSFSYWRARKANSESTGVVNFIKVRRQEDIFTGKTKRICVLLAIGEQERQIQNPQVLLISSKSGDKNKI